MYPETHANVNVLFVHSSRHQTAPWRDASTRYRCYHLAEALRTRGVIADVVSLAELQLDMVDRYQTVCVLRPHAGKTLDRLLTRCRRSGVHTVADVDDLVFIPEYAAMSPSVFNRQATELSVRKRFNNNLNALLSFDELIMATEPLAQHWREQTKGSVASVVPNGLSKRWLGTPVKQTLSSSDAARTVTYMPGSNSHDKDFSEIQDILAETLHRHKDVKLQIVGTLKIDDKLFPRRQVSKIPWVDYYRLPQIIASSTVTLAPLFDSPFTHAKSHIKYIESAAFGTPAICSPSHDICRHTSPGLTIARNTGDWHAALHQALQNPLSSETLNSVQQYVRQTATAEHSANKLLTHWQHSELALQHAA